MKLEQVESERLVLSSKVGALQLEIEELHAVHQLCGPLDREVSELRQKLIDAMQAGQTNSKQRMDAHLEATLRRDKKINELRDAFESQRQMLEAVSKQLKQEKQAKEHAQAQLVQANDEIDTLNAQLAVARATSMTSASGLSSTPDHTIGSAGKDSAAAAAAAAGGGSGRPGSTVGFRSPRLNSASPSPSLTSASRASPVPILGYPHRRGESLGTSSGNTGTISEIVDNVALATTTTTTATGAGAGAGAAIAHGRNGAGSTAGQSRSQHLSRQQQQQQQQHIRPSPRVRNQTSQPLSSSPSSSLPLSPPSSLASPASIMRSPSSESLS